MDLFQAAGTPQFSAALTLLGTIFAALAFWVAVKLVPEHARASLLPEGLVARFSSLAIVFASLLIVGYLIAGSLWRAENIERVRQIGSAILDRLEATAPSVAPSNTSSQRLASNGGLASQPKGKAGVPGPSSPQDERFRRSDPNDQRKVNLDVCVNFVELTYEPLSFYRREYKWLCYLDSPPPPLPSDDIVAGNNAPYVKLEVLPIKDGTIRVGGVIIGEELHVETKLDGKLLHTEFKLPDFTLSQQISAGEHELVIKVSNAKGKSTTTTLRIDDKVRQLSPTDVFVVGVARKEDKTVLDVVARAECQSWMAKILEDTPGLNSPNQSIAQGTTLTLKGARCSDRPPEDVLSRTRRLFR